MTNPSRVNKLKKRLLKEYAGTKGNRLTRENEARAYAMAVYNAGLKSQGKSFLAKKVTLLEEFAANFPVNIEDDELIVGSQGFCPCNIRAFIAEEEIVKCDITGNAGHVIVDYARVLECGINGVLEDISAIDPVDERRKTNKAAFTASFKAFSHYILRHAGKALELSSNETSVKRKKELAKIADICFRLSKDTPRSFYEALQLVWFIHIFLHAEGKTVAFSFGRFDQYLGPYLENDLANGSISIDEAQELLSCFWIKCCYGDESQNLLVGGTNGKGENAENILSILCLKAAAELCIWQPTISVRIHRNTSEEFWEAALALLAKGIGLPTFFADSVPTQALSNAGIPEDRARDWGIVGCFEPTTQGDMYGCTIHASMSLPEIFLDFFHSSVSCSSFQEFYKACMLFIKSRYREKLPEFQRNWNNRKNKNQSPFESACLTGCIESGIMAEDGGARFSLWGVNIAGIGTLVDSLYAVKKLVFDNRELSLEESRKAVANNLDDENLCYKCRNLDGKFGSDSPETNQMAEDISNAVADMVLATRLDNGVRTSPGFFWFGYDVAPKLKATPDGRRDNDCISYGTGPGTYCKNCDVTSILNSTKHIVSEKAPCGSPLIISYPKSELKKETCLENVRHLIDSFFQEGGACIHCNITDANILVEAQKHPDAHNNLTVKISGYSARFNKILPQWQNAIIERTKNSL